MNYIDYNILDCESRINCINNLIENGERFNLEQAANYILNSKDIEKKKKLKYSIFSNRQLFEARIKEITINLLNTEEDLVELDIFIEKTNQKTENKQKIFLRRTVHKCGDKVKVFESDVEKPFIKDYQQFINHCMSIKGNQDYLTQRKLEGHMRDSKFDQKLIKNQMEGTIYFKRLEGESREDNLDWIDLDNKDHILALLKYQSSSLDTWLGCVSFSLREIIESIPWTKKQMDILRLWCVEDYTQEYIGEVLGVTKPAVNQYLDVIATKIVDEYIKQYEEYKYTYWVKGRYKRCSKCGENKLVGEFGKDIRNKNGFKSICKRCDNLHKK